MITSLLLNFISSLLILFFGLLPTVTSMPEWYTNVYNTFSVISGLNAFPVIGTVIQIALLIFTILAGWQAVVWTNWLYNKIRGSG